MALSTQVKVLRAIREILLGDGTNALPAGNDPKPDFRGEYSGRWLPRSTPEAEGLSSDMLRSFFCDVAAAKNANAHSLLVLRHGKVAAEGYFSPYKKGVWHVTHSLCKSFTGSAVGLAVAEGLFSLDDSIAKFFPEHLHFFNQKRYRPITVRHLLTMTSGVSYNEISEAVETDWLKGIFSLPLAFEPGSKFVYNSINSYLLSAIVCRTSGTGLMEYLTPRLFEPMGFGQVGWECSPEGYEKGGWGMYVAVEDMAKLGLLYLQGGSWDIGEDTRQLLPRQWVLNATRTQITGEAGEEYGYHIWTDSKTGSFTMNGMFGQYVTAYPHLDVIVCMTAGNPQLFIDSSAYYLMEQYFSGLSALPDALVPSPVAQNALQRTLRALRFRRGCGQTVRRPVHRSSLLANRWAQERRKLPCRRTDAAMDAFCGITWCFPRNRGGLLPIIIQAMDNNFSSGVHALHIAKRAQGRYLLFWEEGEVTYSLPLNPERAETTLLHVRDESFKTAVTCEICFDEDRVPVLKIEVCFLEHSSFRLLKLSLDGEKLLMRMDEEPQFRIAIESVVEQNTATGAAGKTPADSIPSMLWDSEFLRFRVAQLCAPSVTGTPLPHQPERS